MRLRLPHFVVLGLAAFVAVAAVYVLANPPGEASAPRTDPGLPAGIGTATPLGSAPSPGTQADEPTEAPTAVEVTRPPSGPLEVVFAGDSLAYGLYASTEERGFRGVVVAGLERSGRVEWSRGGQSGNTVKTVSGSITFPQGMDLAVIELGTNDLYKTEVPAFEQHYRDLLRKVERSAPDASIVCVGVWGNVDAARNYDAPIEEACSARGGVFVSITDLFDDPANHGPSGVERFGGLSDQFHPNDKGHAAIASRVLDAIDLAS